MTVRLGTRGSALAMAQSRQAADRIAEAIGTAVELVPITTLGDVHQGSLAAMPRPGVFVSELREALLRGEVDVVVHSMKDLPSEQPDGLAIAAIPARVDPRDVLIARDGQSLAVLASGARVGTGSPRRQACLRRARPDLELVDIRGNVDTRMRKVRDGELDAVVLAAAGLIRLGREAEISEYLGIDDMLPAPAQGALAIEVVADGDLVESLAQLDHSLTRLATMAERQVLSAISASCATAVSAYAEASASGLSLRAEVSGTLAGQFASYAGSAQFGPDFLPVEVALALGATAGQALLDAGAAEYVRPR